MRRLASLAFAVAVAGCDGDPEIPVTPGESRVTAEAVADVEAAMADVRRAPARAAVAPPVPAPVVAPAR